MSVLFSDSLLPPRRLLPVLFRFPLPELLPVWGFVTDPVMPDAASLGVFSPIMDGGPGVRLPLDMLIFLLQPHELYNA